jgi:transcriptional regulator with XRE-family HTH domain
VQQPFGPFLAEAIAAAGYNQLSFATALRIKQARVSELVNGKRTPALERMPKWADVLKLEGASRERFLRLAAIEHLPEAVRPEFVAMVYRLEAIETRLKAAELRRNR